MFMFHIALSMTLLALTAGSALYLYSASCDGKGRCFANITAMLVIFFSITSTLCTMYYGVKSWQAGNDRCAMRGMQDKQMMDDNNSTNMMNDKMNINQNKKR